VFIVAAQGSAEQVTEKQRNHGMLFPSQADILATEVAIATRTAEYIFDNGLATVERPTDIRSWIEKQLYTPQY
jgi:malate dehydrogenase (oxaloacetate-decarboxylating)(NADP+)